jgi:MFS family permease
MPGKWEVLVLMWFAYFFYQADKQIYAVVLVPLQAELGLSGYEAGLVNTVFTLVAALVAPIAGALGDRMPKARVLSVVIVAWSLGTMSSAIAGGLAMMLLTRSILTGTAEAFYPPISHAYLAEVHTTTRALAISIHQSAQYAGPIASGYLAGWIAEHYGWRYSFAVFGGLGVLLGAWMLWRMPRVAVPEFAEPLWAGFAHCVRIPAVRRLGLAFAAELFVTIGYSTWAPAIFGKQFGLSLSQAGFQTSFWSLGSAMGGALLGGMLSDRLAARGRPRVILQAAALAAAVPFLWLLGVATTLPVALFALAATGVFRGIYEGTIAVTLYDYVDAKYRSSAAAVVLVIANLLAAPSAALLGWAGDRASLSVAVSGLSVFFAVGAGVLFSVRKLERETRIELATNSLEG